MVCNDYGSGGWLIWKHPNVRPAIDGRTEIYPSPTSRSYMSFQNAAPGWDAYLRKTGCRTALVPSDLPVAEALVRQTHWTVAARGSTYLLLPPPPRPARRSTTVTMQSALRETTRRADDHPGAGSRPSGSAQ